MKRSTLYILAAVFLLICGIAFSVGHIEEEDDLFVHYTVDTKKQSLLFYWKDEQGHNFSSIANLKKWLKSHHRKLVFAMNGGMYKPDHSPQGLYVEKKAVLNPLDTLTGEGNFYMHPNGVFYLTDTHEPVICSTSEFSYNSHIQYATQSGPMLVQNGTITASFQEDSENLNIRNGVGILPGNKVIFAMSKKPVNFFDFASYFQQMGCENALYLDGVVSRTYLPGKHWTQEDGDFAVIIGVDSPLE